MPIQKLKLDSGEDFRFDSSSESFQAYIQAANHIGIYKQDSSFFFARNLEYIRQKIYEPVYAELKLLNGTLLPMNNSIPEGAETDSYDTQDSTGEADIISSFADDIKTVEVFSGSHTNGIKSIATSYYYSIQDHRKDMMNRKAGQSVVTSKALASRRAIDQKLERLLGFGDVNYNIEGMFNNRNVPVNTVAANGSGSSTLWETKSAINILGDVTKAIDDIADTTEDNEKPNTMIISSPQYRLIEKKELDTTRYSGRTLLQYIEEVYSIKVVRMQQLKNGFLDNTSSGFVLYNNSQDKLEGVMPIRLVVHKPQHLNLATKTILEARCGGVRVFYPNSMSYNVGI